MEYFRPLALTAILAAAILAMLSPASFDFNVGAWIGNIVGYAAGVLYMKYLASA